MTTQAPHEEAERLLEEARVARARRDLDGSTRALDKALKLARAHNAPILIHRAWMDLGTTQRAQRNYEGAMKSFTAASEAALLAGDRVASARALMRYGACLARLKRVDEALAMQNKIRGSYGVDVANEAFRGTESEVGVLMTSAFDDIKRAPDRARAALERILSLADICEPPILIRAYVALTFILEEQHQFREAAGMYEQLAELAGHAGLRQIAADALVAARACALMSGREHLSN